MEILKICRVWGIGLFCVCMISGCVHERVTIVRGNVFVFAALSENREASETDKLSRAVAICALVALELHRETQSWPESEADIERRVASLHRAAWLKYDMRRIDLSRSGGPDCILFRLKPSKAVLATVWADGRMEVPMASPLLLPSSAVAAVPSRKGIPGLINFLLEQLSSPIAK